MMPSFPIAVDYFVRFLLVFFRMGGIIFFVPFYNSRIFAAQIKISLALILSFIIFPLLAVQSFTPPEEPITLLFAVIRELMVGLIIGYAAQLLFTGVQFAGELISFQMGLGMAVLIDPNFQGRSTVVSQLYDVFALMIFLAFYGHHFFIRAAVQTFDVVPLSGFQYSTTLGKYLFVLFGQIFTVAFRIGIPVLIALFLTSVVMGFVARTIPQMNVFLILPVMQIAVGSVMIILSLRATVMMLKFLFAQLEKNVQWLITNM